jgi:hypothetical protein
VNLFASRLLSAVFLAAFVNGCGGCQPGSAPESSDAPARKAPGAAGAGAALATAAPGGTPSRGPQELPTARGLPTLKVDRPAGAGGMQQPQAPADQPAGEEPEEADCSVIADAEPDYGDPPLTVHFSVDYECTEGSATVSWDFGDHSGGAREDNPIHTYHDVGEYTAVVTVTTADGATATDEIDITVESENEGGVPDVEPENP